MTKSLLCFLLLTFAACVAGNTTSTLEETYWQAHRVREDNPSEAIRLFEQVAQKAEPGLARRARMQVFVIYRHAIMEPRLALETLQQFYQGGYAEREPGKSQYERNHDPLRQSLETIDGLEERLREDDGLDTETRTTTLMEIGNRYRTDLQAENYACEAYTRCFLASGEKHDVAYYMMGHSKYEMGLHWEAIAIFDDFTRRFPDSYLYGSAVDMFFRSRYLEVYHLPAGPLQAAAADRLIERIEIELARGDKLDATVLKRLENYRRLTEGLRAPDEAH